MRDTVLGETPARWATMVSVVRVPGAVGRRGWREADCVTLVINGI
jgi:hypothetical protein